MQNPAGRISELWRFPVKSMGGEQLTQAEVTPTGLRGDRALALLDMETGKVASAKSRRLFPDLMACQAVFESEPSADLPLPNVKIALPNGQGIDSLSAGANTSLSAFFGREVRVIGGAPEDFLVDQYHPDLPNLNPAGNRDIVVPQPLGASLFRALGQEPPLDPRSLQDLFPLSVISAQTLATLRAACPTSDMATARFRMNVTLDTGAEDVPEAQWLGKTAHLGDTSIVFTMPAPRCVMTTRPTAGLAEDLHVLRTISEINRLELPGIGAYPCAGVYAVAARAGVVRLGDALRFEE